MALTVNGKVIPDRLLDREVLRLSAGLEMDAPHASGLDPEQVRSAALQNVVTRTLLLQAGDARKLRISSAEIDAERARRWGSANNSVCGADVTESIAEDLLVQKATDDLTRHVPRPARAQAEAFYRQHQQMYYLPEAVEAAHIIRNANSADEEAAAEAVMKQAEVELQQGKPFHQVANRYSDCKGVGGAVGWVVREQTVQEFEDVVFALQPGQRSGIFRTVFGLHIATVSRKRRAGVRPFDEVRLEVANRMFADARRRTLADAVARLRAESDVRFIEETPHV
ncbi:MAG: peptidylprolyl isomerase [Janthinobacterium lividum]